ncbi:MAG: type II toxin-antitoxin system VapC family toxin [Acidobacteriota bacterium]
MNVYLWDTNVLTHYINGEATLQAHLQRVAWKEIALPSVVVAEILRGRSEYALKAPLEKTAHANILLEETRQLLNNFSVVIFDQSSSGALARLQKQHRTHKRHVDLMIAAMAIAGNHVVITRNQKHFADLLPPRQLMNWIDDPPR